MNSTKFTKPAPLKRLEITNLTSQWENSEVVIRDSENAFQEQLGAIRERLDHFDSETGWCLADQILQDEIL